MMLKISSAKYSTVTQCVREIADNKYYNLSESLAPAIVRDL